MFSVVKNETAFRLCSQHFCGCSRCTEGTGTVFVNVHIILNFVSIYWLWLIDSSLIQHGSKVCQKITISNWIHFFTKKHPCNYVSSLLELFPPLVMVVVVFPPLVMVVVVFPHLWSWSSLCSHLWSWSSLCSHTSGHGRCFNFGRSALAWNDFTAI